MNDKEYIKKVCSKCANRYNENDLCNIVRTMDGNYRCSNEKIKKEDRDTMPLLADGNHIVWIPGYRISAYYKVTPETKNIIRINYKNKE